MGWWIRPMFPNNVITPIQKNICTIHGYGHGWMFELILQYFIFEMWIFYINIYNW
jgi:hypothetical protein